MFVVVVIVIVIAISNSNSNSLVATNNRLCIRILDIDRHFLRSELLVIVLVLELPNSGEAGPFI